MLSVFDLAQEDTTWNRKASTPREKKGPCPGCGGTDRFSVKQDDKGRWVFMCRYCWDSQELLPTGEHRGWGDDYDYLRHYRHMAHGEILALRAAHADGDQAIGQQGRPVNRAARAHARAYESDVWQDAAMATVKEYEQALWSPGGQWVADYIMQKRGLSEETARAAHLGYSTKGGIPRLIIPVFNHSGPDNAGRIVAIYRRDLRAGIASGERWQDAPGGTKSELYLADCLKVKRPTVLLEAALDALAVVQECAGMCNVVATGGTGCARNNAVLAALALMPLVLIAFDAEPDKGDLAAQWWLERLPNARRLRPILHDVNDMLVENWDVRQWIGQAIARALTEMEAARSARNPYIDKVLAAYPDMLAADFLALPEDVQQELAAGADVNYCEICLEPGAYEIDGQMYCEEHDPGRAALVKFNALVVDAVPGLVVQGIHKAADWPMIRADLVAEKREAYRQEEYAQRERVRLTIADAERRKRERLTVKQEALV